MQCTACGADLHEVEDAFCTTCGSARPDLATAPRALREASLLDALMLPFQGRDAGSALTIGTLVSLLPLIGQIWLAGYALQWSRRLLLQGERRDLPAWDEWGRLFVDGMWASLLISVFTLIPGTFVAAFAVMRLVGAIAASSGAGVDFWPLIASLAWSFLIGSIVLVACSLPAPLAICHYASTGRLMESLHPASWMPLIMRAPLEFATSWGVLLLALVVCTVALATVGLVPLLGPMVAAVGFWLLGVVGLLSSHAIFARYYLRHAGRPLPG